MTIYESLRLYAAAGCGIQIGGFLLLSLFHRPLLVGWPADISLLWLYQRFYRFNTAISVISGILAILGNAKTTGFLLAILGMSYILLLIHLLPLIQQQNQQIVEKQGLNLRRSPAEILHILKYLQISIHLTQLLVLIYLLIRLA